MNQKEKFAVEIIKQYANEKHIPARSTSDLSPMEKWLILRLFDHVSKSEQCEHEFDIDHKSDFPFDVICRKCGKK